MAIKSFMVDMYNRKFRPVLWGDCSNCAAFDDCKEIHGAHRFPDSCRSFFMKVHGISDGHWVKL